MKPFYTKATTQFDNSVTIRYDMREHFYPHWHYHDEYELVFIHKSSGIRYVGDSINPFHPGDLVLLGSRLPHIWINKRSDADTKKLTAVSTVIHFQRKFVHNAFFDLPLMDKIKNLFELSARGIRFSNFSDIDQQLDKIQNSASSERIISVLELLTKLCDHPEYEYLSSKEYNKVASDQRGDRLSKIHDYIAVHFREKMSLETLADIAHMTPQAFCSFFKRKTAKTVFTYINHLRIGYSCKLLIETELTVDQIAHQSGYNNTTFFNRKFKAKMMLTPKEYRQKFRINKIANESVN